MRQALDRRRGSGWDDRLPAVPLRRGRVFMRMLLRVINSELLHEYANRRIVELTPAGTWKPGSDPAAAAAAVLMYNENPNPAEYGIRFDSFPAYDEVRRGDERLAQLEAAVVVFDPQKLRDYAVKRHAAAGSPDGPGWEPASTEDAVWRALVVLNENPPMRDYGLDLVEHELSFTPMSD